MLCRNINPQATRQYEKCGLAAQGGGHLTITGTLANTGAVQVGPNNLTLGAQTSVTLGGLTNATGASFILEGSAAHAATLAFSGSGFTENDGTFQLVYATPLTLSSSVTNKGSFDLNDNTALTVDGGFTNSSALNVDNGTSQGGSSLKITGTLANTGAVQVGPNNLTLGAQTSVTLGGLTNATGASFVLEGSAAHAATLAFSGSGFTENDGTFQLVYATPLTLSSSVTNKGSFDLNDNTALTVDGGFTNSSALNVDNGTSQGGSSLKITGTLANTGAVQVGPNNLTLGAQTSVTLGGLTNATGASFVLEGSAAHAATLILNGAASNSGRLVIGSFAVLDVTSAGMLAATGGSKIDISSGSLTNLSGTTLTGGTYEVDAGSTLQLPNSTYIVTLAADLTLSGIGSVVESLNTTTNVQVQLEQTLTTIAADGTLSVLAGRSYTTANIVTNNGKLTVADGGKIDFSVGGLTNLSGTTLTGGNYVIDAGSTLQLPNNSTIVMLDADLTLSGVGSVVESLNTGVRVPLEQTLTTIASGGALNVLGGRSYTTTNKVTDAGALQIGAGSTFTAAALKVAGTLTNAGTINGGGGTAVTFAASSDRLILNPGATFGGTVVGGGVNTTLELAQGSGIGTLNALGTTFTNFGTVIVDSGATWTVKALSSALAGVALLGNGTAIP